MSSCLIIKDANLRVLLFVFTYLLLQINILFLTHKEELKWSSCRGVHVNAVKDTVK
jgi:hypothetical protein